MKSKLMFALSTLVGLLFVQSANAQRGGYCEWYPASCLVQGNLNLVGGTVNQGRWARVNQVFGRAADYALDHAGYAAGGHYPGGYLNAGGYRDYEPIGRREQNVSLGAATGLTVYGLTGDGGKGLAAGAGTFGLLTAVDAIRGRGRDEYGRLKPVDCSKRKLNRREQETCEAIEAEQERREAEAQSERKTAREAAQRQAQADAELEKRQLKGGYLRNSSKRWNLEVTDCASSDRPMTRVRIAVLRPGQRVPVIGAICGYEGTFFVRSTSVAGVVDEQVAAFIISDDAGGWVFHLPEVSQKGGR